jgi:hypothetical protein
VVRRVLICLAFATWCFLNFWVALSERRTVYFLRRSPVEASLPKVIGWELIVMLAMLAVWETGRKRPQHRRWIDALFLVACIFPLGMGSAALARILPFDLTHWIQGRSFWPAAIAVGAVVFGLAVRRPAASAVFLRSLFLWSWPLLGVAVLQAGAMMLRYGSSDYADLSLAPRMNAAPAEIRVVWIIFDELSQTVAFTSRPQGLRLPNFDRMKMESFYATAASAPADATLLSMPSLILGERVLRAEPDGPADLRVQTQGRTGWSSWSSANNVFDSAREAGFNTALVGWYHPYGRLLNRSLTDCFWTAAESEPGVEEGYDSSLFAAMQERLWLQIANLPLAGHLRLFSPRRHEQRVRSLDLDRLRQQALQIAADSNIGVMLIHLPVPHPPAVDLASAGGYIDNVALADRTLGDLRRSMEQADVWNQTAVVVSADHGWRIGLWRGMPEWTPAEEAFASSNTSGVPFLVKLPYQSEPVVYEKPFDTVVTRNILTAIFKRQISATGQISTLIEGVRGQTR